MSTKSTRLVDNQGRVIIPNHIRKALNLTPGNLVEVELDDDNNIRIRATQERCAVCGKSVEGKHRAEITASKKSDKKFICYECSQKILKNVLK